MADRSESLVRALAQNPRRTGVFCDFDGCLAPIVPVPEDAKPVRGTSAALQRLAERFAVVAVVSGRPVSFLAKRLRAPAARLVGLYGIEQRIGGRLVVDPEAAGARAVIEEAARRLETELAGLEGVYVEHKGLAIGIHFRRARDPAGAQRAAFPVVERIARAGGLGDVQRGRMVLEIRPRAGGDKGDAVRNIVRETGITAGLVAGDDVGDLASFAAVSGLSPSVRVAVGSSESPPELLRRADITLDDPAALVALLRSLADATGP